LPGTPGGSGYRLTLGICFRRGDAPLVRALLGTSVETRAVPDTRPVVPGVVPPGEAQPVPVLPRADKRLLGKRLGRRRQPVGGVVGNKVLEEAVDAWGRDESVQDGPGVDTSPAVGVHQQRADSALDEVGVPRQGGGKVRPGVGGAAVVRVDVEGTPATGVV